MAVAKRTYSLPEDTVREFEALVGSGDRSQRLNEALRAWLETQRRDALRREIIAGCLEMSDLYKEVCREWEPLDNEVEQALVSNEADEADETEANEPPR